MPSGRSEPGATAITGRSEDGDAAIVVAGGDNRSRSMATAVIYNPTENKYVVNNITIAGLSA